jgi:ribonuclease BN (tRNA processing enzyme)
MRLTVLGAGPAYSDRPEARGAAYLVTAGSTNVLLDLGQGSFSALFPHISPADLDAVAISHLHPDHFIDLVPLRHFLRYEFAPPRRVRVIGPGALVDRLDGLHAQPGFTAESLDTETIGTGEHRVGELRLRATRVVHTDDSYAIRVATKRGPGLVYTGDCGRADDVLPLLERGDVLLSEVATGPGPVPAGMQHLDGPAVGRLAAAAGAGRLLLTHILMGHDLDATIASVRRAYDGPVEFVWPGTILEL